jgi:2-polyprenyl-6-methoxyphenol hydroxylase-like FAD-dependent oxidoreductase
MSDVVDVAIIGAGPVGQLLALLLGRQGWRVAVLERRHAPFPLPRAVHLDHESARILQAAGLMCDLAPVSEPVGQYEWRDAVGRALMVVQAGPGLSGWPESVMFCQADLEGLLARELALLENCRACWQWEADGLAGRPDGYEVTATTADGRRMGVTARWVVACDGANSTARALLEVPVEDLGYSFDWVVADVRPLSATGWEGLNVQICDPARPTTAVSGGPGRRRLEFLCLPGETLEGMARPEVLWSLLERLGVSPANAELERYTGYTFQSRLACEWQVGANGRVLLAGDAAHQMPPFAGQGLCSGLRDVANLAWKLGLVLSGRAGAELMATYASERQPDARAATELSVALGRLVCVVDAAEAAGRDAAMVPTALSSGPLPIPPAPPLGPGATRAGDVHAGELGLQAMVEHDGIAGLFDDVAGTGWQLLSPLGDPLVGAPPSLSAWYRTIGGRSAHVARGAPFGDIEGKYQAWFDDLGAGVVLQRPDFRLFGTAGALQGATELLLAAQRCLQG